MCLPRVKTQALGKHNVCRGGRSAKTGRRQRNYLPWARNSAKKKSSANWVISARGPLGKERLTTNLSLPRAQLSAKGSSRQTSYCRYSDSRREIFAESPAVKALGKTLCRAPLSAKRPSIFHVYAYASLFLTLSN